MTTTMTDLQTGRTHVFNEALPGRDAYEEALAHGFVGTREEWLAHLRGFAFDPVDPEWEIDRAYTANAAVRHAHKLWVARVQNTGVEPGTDPDTWSLLLDGADAQALADAVAAAQASVSAADSAAAAATTAASSVVESAREALFLGYARDDIRCGRSWSLADWYRDDESRFDAAAWYDATDIATLFQDVDGTIPVAAPGDEVRLIKAKNGVADHDLIINDPLLPAIYRERGSVGCVDLNSVAGFKSRGNVTLAAPLFLAAAVAWRSPGDALFGVVRSSVAYLQLTSPPTVQNRPQLMTNGSGIGEQGYNPLEGEFGYMPNNAPLVIHSQISAGSHDVAINGLNAAIEANTWTGTGSDAGSWITLGMATNTVEADADADFYGGVVFFGTMDADTRALMTEYLRLKAERPARATDRHILVLGDSTGDNALETTGVGATATAGGDWPYKFVAALAADNSGYHVSHRRYFHEQGWSGAQILQDGTAGAILCWNASIAGAQPGQHLGRNYESSIRAVPTCDTIIINHGYNIEAGTTTKSIAAMSAALMGLIETAKAAHPGAHIFITRQSNKATFDPDMLTMAQAVDALCGLYGATPLDIYDEFENYQGPDNLWSDGLHFTEAGAQLAASRAKADYDAALPLDVHGPGFLVRRADNLLHNGRFFDWTGGTPDNWTKTGAGILKEIIGPDGDSPVAVEITDTTSTSTYLSQTIDASSYQGQTITLGARLKITPEEGQSPVSSLHIVTDGTGGTTTIADMRSNWRGGWLWHFSQCTVPSDATTITVRLYARSSGAGGLTVAYSEVALVTGDRPRRAAI